MGLYVYGILDAGGDELPSVTGILAQPVYRLDAMPLAAIVSDCVLETVRAERKHIAASQRVLSRLSAAFDLLPMAFGTVAESEGELCRFLDGHRDLLLAQLRRVAGRVEMSLRLSLDVADPIRHAVAATPELRAARDRLFGRGRPPTHDERLRLGQLCEEALRRYREEQSQQVLTMIAPHCAEISPLPLRAERDIAELAVLVPRDRVEAFEAAVSDAAVRLPEDLAFTIGGPWPPHNFVKLSL